MHIVVGIVEDDPKCRSSLSHVVLSAPDMQLAGVASDVDAGRNLIDSTPLHVLLVDLGLPSGSGLSLIAYVCERQPDCDVMVISVFDDERHVLAAIEAGATGYLLKDDADGIVAEQIRSLRAGGSPISPVIARRLLARLATGETRGARAGSSVRLDEPVARLSPQEVLVLQMSAKGYTYAEIARILGVSGLTVSTHVKRSYRKLQVHSKTEAVYEARRLGWLQD